MEWREALGRRVQEARQQQRYSVKSAAEAALVARDTWSKIEKGLPVHDANLRAALDLLRLDEHGQPVAAERARMDIAWSGPDRVQLSTLNHALSGAVELGTLAGSLDETLEQAGDRLIADATDLYRAARLIIEERSGGDGDAQEPRGSAPTRSDYALVADEDETTIEDEQEQTERST